MNRYKIMSKLNWGTMVSGFWVKVANIAQKIGRYALRKGTERVMENLKLVEMLEQEKYSQKLPEINKILEEL